MHKFFFYIKTSINLIYEFFFIALKSVHLYLIASTLGLINKYFLVVALMSNICCCYYLNFFDAILFKFPVLLTPLILYVNTIAVSVDINLLLTAGLTSTVVSPLIPYLQGNLFFVLQMLFLVVISIWARAAGPRARLDQLFTMTWKDMFIKACLFSFFIYVLFIFV